MGFLERHIEQAKKNKNQANLLEFMECVYGDLNIIEGHHDIRCLIKEDFIDNIEDIDALRKENIVADDEYKAMLSFSVTTRAGKDDVIFKTDDVSVVGIETIISKVKKFT